MLKIKLKKQKNSEKLSFKGKDGQYILAHLFDFSSPFASSDEEIVISSNKVTLKMRNAVLKTIKITENVRKAIWAVFTNISGEQTRLLCLLASRTVYLYDLKRGLDYFCSFESRVQSIWPLREGILVETQNTPKQQTRLFSLTHPLDPPKPIKLIQKDGQTADFPPDEKIVFSSPAKPLLAAFCPKSQKHKLYAVRRSQSEVDRRLSFGSSFLKTPEKPNSEQLFGLEKSSLSFSKKDKFAKKSPVLGVKRKLFDFLQNSDFLENSAVSEEGDPETFLEVWWESSFESPAAGRVFLASDLRGQSLLCFFCKPTRHFYAYNLPKTTHQKPNFMSPSIDFPCQNAIPIKSPRNLLQFGQMNLLRRNNPQNSQLKNLAQWDFYDEFAADFDLLVLGDSGQLSLWAGDTQIADLDHCCAWKITDLAFVSDRRFRLFGRKNALCFYFEKHPKSKVVKWIFEALAIVLDRKKLLSLKLLFYGEMADLPPDKVSKNRLKTELGAFSKTALCSFQTAETDKSQLELIHKAIHFLYESLKLDSKCIRKFSRSFAEFLFGLSAFLGKFEHCEHYCRDFGELFGRERAESHRGEASEKESVFDLVDWVRTRLSGGEVKLHLMRKASFAPFETLRKFCFYLDVLSRNDNKVNASRFSFENSFHHSLNGLNEIEDKIAMTPTKKRDSSPEQTPDSLPLFSPIKLHFSAGKKRRTEPAGNSLLKRLFSEEKLSKEELRRFPPPLASVLTHLLGKKLAKSELDELLEGGSGCLEGVELLRILGRNDLASNCFFGQKKTLNSCNPPFYAKTICFETAEKTYREKHQKDLRLKEVARCICPSTPFVLSCTSADMACDDEAEWKQRNANALLALFKRGCAMALGEAPFLFGTNALDETGGRENIDRCGETINAQIRLKGCGKTHTAPLESKAAKIAKNLGEFYSSAALGLSLKRGLAAFRREDILSFPQENAHSHAGFLLGVGVGGYLNLLNSNDLFEYFQSQREIVSTAIILGLSIDSAGSGNSEIFKMVSLHIPFFMPSSLTESEKAVSPLLQSTALLCVGLLYMATQNAAMASFALTAFENSTKDGQEADLGQLSLPSALCLGLINLGKGVSCRLSNLKISDLLLRISAGGKRVEKPNSKENRPKRLKNSLTFSGENIDLFVSAPGALMALALIYLKTNDEGIASTLRLRNSAQFLSQIRPEFAFYRLLSLNLIRWSEISPSNKWLDERIPAIIRNDSSLYKYLISGQQKIFLPSTRQNDLLLLYSLMGCCTALSMRFAGSHNAKAFEFVLFFLRGVKAAKAKLLQTVPQSCYKSFIVSQCLSLSIIMAGSCNLTVLRFLRSIRKIDSNLNSSEKELVSLAFGFLNLGGGKCSLNTSDKGVAGLLLASFPVLISRSFLMTDVYPSFFRYLWVLAAENRYIETVDVDSKEITRVGVTLRFLNKNAVSRKMAPCLLPKLETIEEIVINDDSFYPLSLKSALIEQLESDPIVFVKRKSGSGTNKQNEFKSRLSGIDKCFPSRFGSYLEQFVDCLNGREGIDMRNISVFLGYWGNLPPTERKTDIRFVSKIKGTIDEFYKNLFELNSLPKLVNAVYNRGQTTATEKNLLSAIGSCVSFYALPLPAEIKKVVRNKTLVKRLLETNNELTQNLILSLLFPNYRGEYRYLKMWTICLINSNLC